MFAPQEHGELGNQLLSKGRSTKGPKISFISNLKKPTCAFKQDVLELATLRYVNHYCKVASSNTSHLEVHTGFSDCR